ncbi:MAG TPA: thiolase family protein [Candidatus Binatia bacterium]|jgi:acetyl-CoA acetyltransferase|nr:thiolase family protein [Candidatus Binatia bacterium]
MAESGRKYCIVGIGESKLGQVPQSTSLDLTVRAAVRALEDAGLRPHQVDGCLSKPPYQEPTFLFTDQLAATLGLRLRYGHDLHAGGCTPILAVANAVRALEAGLCHTVLIAFGENMFTHSKTPQPTHGKLHWGYEDWEEPFGLVGPPAGYALAARRHMHCYGTTIEQLGTIAVTQRQHAILNEGAQMRRPLTLADYLQSPWIVEPFRLPDCSLVSDYGGAFVVTTAERAADLRQRPVAVLSYGESHPHRYLMQEEDLTRCGALESGPAALRMAGVSLDDIDFAELYDSFTYTVLVQLEDYGFCAKGEGGTFVEGGRIALGGALPVNTHGGLLSQAHADGILHVTEAVKQLRGHAGPRQVADARLGLVSGGAGVLAVHASLLLARS